MSLKIEVPIPDDLGPELARRARTAGLDIADYAAAVLTRDLKARARLAEILASFREQVASSGLADSELDELFTTARNEIAAN